MSDAALGIDRSVSGQPWRWRRPQNDAKWGEALVDELLLGRGVLAHELARHRSPTIRDFLPDPSLFRDMDKAANRVADAVERGETIAIFGDYDVDGATSSALLVLLLRQLGIEPLVHIPDRLAEGYGPNLAALLALKARGASLVVTVDCGAQAFEPLAAARDAGLDVVVIDHHKCSPELPPAHALVNPNRLDESEIGLAHGHVAAVGMAFLLGVALVRTLRARGAFVGREEPRLIELLDLVALATVCDVMPLTGVNRALVAQGLKVMARRDRVGLRALADVARLDSAPSCHTLGFLFGPRVNAGGRIGAADLGARLLCCTDEAEAKALAQRLDELNSERREIENRVRDEAMAQAEARGLDGPLVWAAGEGWHPGVVGIVASRLKEATNRPAVVIGLDGAEGKGSGRSVTGVDLGAAIQRVAAEGLQDQVQLELMDYRDLPQDESLEAAMARLGDLLARRGAGQGGPADLKLDGLLMPQAATVALVEKLEEAGPFGASAPAPRFAFADMAVTARRVGESHLKVSLSDGLGARVEGIAFGAFDSALGPALSEGGHARFHLAGKLELNVWNGRTTAQLRVEDAARA